MRTSFVLALLLMSASAFAQKQELLSYPPVRSMAYGGFGGMFASSEMGRNSLIGDGISYRLGYFQGIGKPVHSRQGTWLYGIEARLEYSKFQHVLIPPGSVQNLRYANGGTEPARVFLQVDQKEKKPDAFQYLIGPSARFENGPVFFQPSVLVGYGSVSQEEFRFYDSIRLPSDPAQNALINFYSAGHETNNGFLWTPGLKGGYRASKRLSIFADLTYTYGAKQDFEDQLFVPQGQPDASGAYTFNQLKNGTFTTYRRQSRFRAFFASINVGLTF